jgi:hypothetical protein
MGKLSAAEAERIQVLIEECAEFQSTASKILRSGFNHFKRSNELAMKIAYLESAIDLIVEFGDVDIDRIDNYESVCIIRRKSLKFQNTEDSEN